jgi:hypothetical protein
MSETPEDAASDKLWNERLDQMAAQVNATENPFIGIHEVYTQMMAAGFSTAQAGIIVGVWLAHKTETGA